MADTFDSSEISRKTPSGIHLFVTNSLTGGGAERAMNTLVNELYRKGIDVVLAPLNIGPTDLVIVECPVLEPIRTWKSGLIDTYRAFKKFRREVDSLKPSTITLNCDLPEFFGALCFGSFQLIVVEHASRPWPKRTLLGKLIRLILKVRKSKWVSVSSHLKIWSLKNVVPTVIPNSIANLTDNFEGINYPEEVKRLIFIGRLSPEKDPKYFLNLLKFTGKRGLLFGDGVLLNDLKSVALEQTLDVEFFGFTTQFWHLISKSDLIVVTSLNEGDGLVVVEAINQGYPIILRDIPDLRRFGFESKFYFSSPEEFSSRISSQMHSYLITEENRKRLLRPRDPETVSESWANFLAYSNEEK